MSTGAGQVPIRDASAPGGDARAQDTAHGAGDSRAQDSAATCARDAAVADDTSASRTQDAAAADSASRAQGSAVAHDAHAPRAHGPAVAHRAGAECERFFGHYFERIELFAEIGEDGKRAVLRFGGDQAFVDTPQTDPGRPAFVENSLKMSAVRLRDQQVKCVGA